MSQELNIIEKEETFVNPHKKTKKSLVSYQNIISIFEITITFKYFIQKQKELNKEKQEQETFEPKKKKKEKRKRGPGLTGSKLDL